MKNITTYYATRKNVLVWLAALLSIASAVARIAFVCASDVGTMNIVVRVILPVAANLLLAFRLPMRGEKQFYVTILPVLIMIWALCLDGITGAPQLTKILVIACSVILALLYFLTFNGKIPTQFIVLVFLIGSCIGISFYILGKPIWNINWTETIVNSKLKWMFYSDIAGVLAILATILSARKMPPWKEGDPYRLRFGDRLDGRRIHNMPVMSKLTPFFMLNRLNRSNLLADTVEVSNMEKYITQKRKEGLRHFGITHVILAAYVRTIAEMPELNRFVSGLKVYQRFETSVNMVVKKEMSKDAPDSSIRVRFQRDDTAKEVYERFDFAMNQAREEGIANSFDSITHILDYFPSFVMAAFATILRVMDFFSVIPSALEQISPFHGSLYITSMGSLGIPPIFHHLYDFGNVPVFFAFGHKYTKYELNKNGETVTRKYIDYKIICDEGICDGFYYASALKKIKSYLTHPERLDLPPEKVVEDIY